MIRSVVHKEKAAKAVDKVRNKKKKCRSDFCWYVENSLSRATTMMAEREILSGGILTRCL